MVLRHHDEQRPDELPLRHHPGRYRLFLLDADAALAQLGALDERVGLDGPVRDPARPLLDPRGDRVLCCGEDGGHLGGRRPTAWAITGRSTSAPATGPGLLVISGYPTAAAIAVADSCGVTMQKAGILRVRNSAVR